MKRDPLSADRREPSFEGLFDDSDAPPDRQPPTPAATRASLLCRCLRGLRKALLVFGLIVALSYLPPGWTSEWHPHLQEALRICRDIRELLIRIGLDTGEWLHSEGPVLIAWLRSLLPAGLRAGLAPDA
ncbi:MAG: hypothetical protein R3202_07525 [Candidatus Competibacterales bacterium]|nr:hypothetical protein [Candidatus Competibacterales bacterium]